MWDLRILWGGIMSYDEVNGFVDYTNREEWKEYINSYVIPLWSSSWSLKEYWMSLKDEFNELSFENVGEGDRPLFLGGIRDDETIYTENSLAKFYNRFFGAGLKDARSWILQSKKGGMLTDIKVEVVESDFIKFVKEVFNLLNSALSHQRLVECKESELELDYDELKKDPNKVRETIRDFYRGVLNISLNHNYGTFFLCSINQITYRYMKTAYPRIDDVLDFLMEEFGLTELEWNNPIKQESELFRECTIYHFPKESFGGAIFELNDVIWEWFSKDSFRETLSMLFDKVPDLKENFIERVRDKLPETYYAVRWFVEWRKDLMTNEGKLLIDILDEYSPHLFLNRLRIDEVNVTSDRIWFYRMW